MNNLVITVNYKVKAEYLERFIELLKENSKNSLTEPGCLNYEASIDGCEVFLYEKYKTEEDFVYHTTRPYFKVYGDNTKGMLDKKIVSKYVAL